MGLVFCFCFGCVVLIVVRCGFVCKCLVVVFAGVLGGLVGV